MGDLVSRQAAIDVLEANRFPGASYVDTGIKIAIRLINGLPSAQRWIPCSERLPGIGQDILLTVKDDFTWIAEGCYRADDKWWQYRWNTVLEHNEVIAWMPLPEPYKEDEHEDN